MTRPGGGGKVPATKKKKKKKIVVVKILARLVQKFGSRKMFFKIRFQSFKTKSGGH